MRAVQSAHREILRRHERLEQAAARRDVPPRAVEREHRERAGRELRPHPIQLGPAPGQGDREVVDPGVVADHRHRLEPVVHGAQPFEELVVARPVQLVVHDHLGVAERVRHPVERLSRAQRRGAQDQVGARDAPSADASAIRSAARWPLGASGRSWSASAGSSQLDFACRSSRRRLIDPSVASGGDRPRGPAATRCPRQDSNLRPRLRRPVLYPLSYEGSRSESSNAIARPTPKQGRARGSVGYASSPMIEERLIALVTEALAEVARELGLRGRSARGRAHQARARRSTATSRRTWRSCSRRGSAGRPRDVAELIRAAPARGAVRPLRRGGRPGVHQLPAHDGLAHRRAPRGRGAGRRRTAAPSRTAGARRSSS